VVVAYAGPPLDKSFIVPNPFKAAIILTNKTKKICGDAKGTDSAEERRYGNHYVPSAGQKDSRAL